MPTYNQYGNYPYGNPYQPYGVNPNYQNNYGNQMQQPQMFQQQSQQPQMNQYAFVNGLEGAKSFQVPPNQTILLMDSDNPLCYMKSSNSVGQSTLRYFKLTEVTENELKGNNSQPQKNQDYVLKTDFDALSKRLDELSKKIEKPYKSENSKANKGE